MTDRIQHRVHPRLLPLLAPPVMALAAATLSPAQDRSVPANPTATAPSSLGLTGDIDSDRLATETKFRNRLLPPPIETSRFDSLLEQLDVEDEAKKDLQRAYRSYVDEHARLRKGTQQKLEILLPASYRYDPLLDQFEPVHTPELVEALRIRAPIAKGIVDAEASLEVALGRACNEEKRGLWRTLRVQRAQELFGSQPRLPGANVNLLDLIPKCGLTSEEIRNLEGFFEKYATEYTEALRRRWLGLQDNEAAMAVALVGLGPEWRFGRNEIDALEIDRSLAKIDVDTTLLDRGLASLNDQSLASLRTTLQPASMRKITEAYRKRVHPEVYEDERSYRLLVEEMVGLPTLDQDSIGGVVHSLALTEERLRPTGQQAVELADGIITAESLAAPDSAAAKLMLQSKLQSVLEKRRRMIRDGVNALRAMVPSTEPDFVLRLDAALASLAAVDRAGRFLRDGYDARIAEIGILEAERAAEEEAALEAERDETSSAPVPATQTISPTSEDTPPPPPSDPQRRSRGSRGN